MNAPAAEDSSRPEFWNARFAAGQTPWDSHGVPGELTAYLAGTRPGQALIPGCGSAYEVQAFCSAGWVVTAIDFASVAVARAKQFLGPLGECVVLGDFFRHPLKESSFDLVYERTFLCALAPRMWPEYAARIGSLLRRGGALAGFFFLYGAEAEPPPYPMTKAEAAELFGRRFILTQDGPASHSLPLFVGKERWQEWTRRT